MAEKRILVKHPETDGVAEVSLSAFEAVWRAKGFEVVEYDHEGDLQHAAEQYDEVVDAEIVDEESEPVSGPDEEEDVPSDPEAPDVD